MVGVVTAFVCIVRFMYHITLVRAKTLLVRGKSQKPHKTANPPFKKMNDMFAFI